MKINLHTTNRQHGNNINLFRKRTKRESFPSSSADLNFRSNNTKRVSINHLLTIGCISQISFLVDDQMTTVVPCSIYTISIRRRRWKDPAICRRNSVLQSRQYISLYYIFTERLAKYRIHGSDELINFFFFYIQNMTTIPPVSLWNISCKCLTKSLLLFKSLNNE